MNVIMDTTNNNPQNDGILFMRRKENQKGNTKTLFDYIYIHCKEPGFIAFYDSLDTFPTQIYEISRKEISIYCENIVLNGEPEYEQGNSWRQIHVNSLFPERWLQEINLKIMENHTIEHN